MTEEEGILLNEIRNEFYIEFSQLVAKHLSRVPEHLRANLLMQLSDTSSVYGSCYEDYMK
jgi:hypothetical protein